MARRIDQPRPGFFALRLCKGGVKVGAVIYRDCPMYLPEAWHDSIEGEPGPEDWCRYSERSRLLTARINGRVVEVDRVWTSGEEISEAEYRYLIDRFEHYSRFKPEHPFAKPRQPVELDSMGALF